MARQGEDGERLTLIDEGEAVEIASRSDGERIYLDPDAVQRALGWKLEPEGLCREGICVPVQDREALVNPAGLELGALAAALGRPLAVEPGERVAALGTAAADRGQQLLSLEAPDFELPDLSGKLHSLAEHRGEKILLFMHASW